MIRQHRGLALIVVVAVLGVLAVLATCFATLARLERCASQQRIHQTQALLLARSGLEDALARLDMGQDALARESGYRGEDWDDDGTLTAEGTAETYCPGVLNTQDCPLPFALRPSFFSRDPLRRDAHGLQAPARIRVDGLERGSSGSFTSRGCYALKIEDESGKLCVNGGILGGTPAQGWNGPLTRILGNLGRRLGLPALGTDLMTMRPQGGYRSLDEVQAAAGTSTTDLSPYLCLAAWTDRKVIRPSSRTINYRAYSDLKKARGALLLEEGGRPPVNLNAASGPVLAALIEGLQGDLYHLNIPEVSFVPDWTRVTWPVPYAVTAASADAIAGAVLASRPFRTWPDFEAFLDSLVPSVLNGYFAPGRNPSACNLGLSDLLKANFNPNTMLEKQMPDELSWRWIDKSDLTAWSTEGNLSPTGNFTLHALGRVTGPDGKLLASTGASALVRAFDLLRQTTQRDFVEGRTPDASGTSYLSLANPFPVFPIPPQRTTGASAGWNTWAAGRGLGAITYPCPMPAVNAGNAADCDGCIGLASVEMPSSDPTGGSLLFLQHFDDGWNADFVLPTRDERLKPTAFGADSGLQRDCTLPVWPASGVEPNTLHPDGAFLQDGRCPSYSAWNLPRDADLRSNHGSLSYWVKRNSRDLTVSLDFSCVKREVRSRTMKEGTQALMVGRGGGTSWGELVMGIILENWAEPDPAPAPWASSDGLHEQGSGSTFLRSAPVNYGLGVTQLPAVPDMRWRLVGAFYDDDERIAGRDVWASVMGVSGSRPEARYDPNPLNLFNGPSGEKLVTSPAAIFTLGCDGDHFDGFEVHYVQHAVLDEFAICDFKDDALVARPRFDAWVLNRFQDGRYYKGDDGTFLSVPLAPSLRGSCRLLSASWTERLPSQERLETRRSSLTDASQALIPRLHDRRLDNTRLQVDLLESGGTLTGPGIQRLDSPGGSPIQRSLPAFRYRVRFRTSPLLDPVTGLPDDANQPVLETPFLDDITFAWQPAEGPSVLSWKRE